MRDKYLKCTDEVDRVGSFIRSSTGVVINHVLLIIGMIYKLLELCDVLPSFAEIKWAEVFVEIIVDEVLFYSDCTLSILK